MNFSNFFQRKGSSVFSFEKILRGRKIIKNCVCVWDPAYFVLWPLQTTTAIDKYVKSVKTHFFFFQACWFEGDKQFHLAGSKWHPYIPPWGFSRCALCTCLVNINKQNKNTWCKPRELDTPVTTRLSWTPKCSRDQSFKTFKALGQIYKLVLRHTCHHKTSMNSQAFQGPILYNF